MTDDKPSNDGTNLTKKQQAFVDEYLIDLNGAQAAIRAGYSENTAKVIANENLTKPYIKQAINPEEIRGIGMFYGVWGHHADAQATHTPWTGPDRGRGF